MRNFCQQSAHFFFNFILRNQCVSTWVIYIILAPTSIISLKESRWKLQIHDDESNWLWLSALRSAINLSLQWICDGTQWNVTPIASASQHCVLSLSSSSHKYCCLIAPAISCILMIIMFLTDSESNSHYVASLFAVGTHSYTFILFLLLACQLARLAGLFASFACVRTSERAVQATWRKPKI